MNAPDPLQRIHDLEQENEELRQDIKRHIAAMRVEAEANGYLRSKLNEAQRELGRMEATQDERIAELADALAKLEEAARAVQAGEWDRDSIQMERSLAQAVLRKHQQPITQESENEQP